MSLTITTRRALQWMRDNVPPGQFIFNTDWDDFPRLFYFDPSHYYVSGLDPSYLFDKDPDLSRLYDRITLGQEEDPGPLIRDRFGARYVFSDNSITTFSSMRERAAGLILFTRTRNARSCTFGIRRLEENPLGEPDDE